MFDPEVGTALSSVLGDVKGGFVNVYDDLKKNLGTEEQKLLSSTNEFVQLLNSAVIKGGEFFGKNEKLNEVDKSITESKPKMEPKTNISKLEVDMSNIKPDNNIDVLKNIENKLSIPKEQILEMASLTTKENLSGDIVLTIKIDTSDSDIKSKFERLLQSDTQTRELLVKALVNARSDDGRKGYLKK